MVPASEPAATRVLCLALSGGAGVAEKGRGFFGWRRIDVEAGSPFEAGDLRQARKDLEVPVEIEGQCIPVVRASRKGLRVRSGMQNDVEGRVFQRRSQTP